MRPHLPISWSAAFVGLLWLSALPTQAGQLTDAIEEINADVLFLRHALAPGFGDPANFSIHDCSTQRNLSQAGREQSRRIGQYLRDEAIGIEAILSSRWCRCVETAAELGLGPFTTHDGLNSFFDGHVDRAETIRLLRTYLDRMKVSSASGSVTMMVTHQVVIMAITGIAPQSGGFVAYNSRTRAVKRAGTPVQSSISGIGANSIDPHRGFDSVSYNFGRRGAWP